MKEFVLDASALIHSIGDEAGSIDAAEFFLRERHLATLTAPGLLVWEIGNFAHGRTRRRADADLVSRHAVLESLIRGIRLEATDEQDLRQVAAFAEEFDLTFYDAAYLELAARSTDRALVTEDLALVQAAASLLGKRRVVCFGPRAKDLLVKV